MPGYALLQGELEEETASKNVTVSPKPETARGLLKRAKLADISLDVLQVKLLSLGFPCWGTPFLQGELEEETASKNVTVGPKPETARGLLE